MMNNIYIILPDDGADVQIAHSNCRLQFIFFDILLPGTTTHTKIINNNSDDIVVKS